MSVFTSERAKIALASITSAALAAVAVPTAVATSGDASRQQSVSVTTQIERNSHGYIDSRVRGTFGRAGQVRGTFHPDRFFVKRGGTYANGLLRARLIRGNGTVIGVVERRVTLPVKNARSHRADGRATCDVLNLVLGPLDLNLLGLNVHLNRVVLDVTATAGAGQLLGNLLCSVVGLLDGSPLQLSSVLNRILAILGIA